MGRPIKIDYDSCAFLIKITGYHALGCRQPKKAARAAQLASELESARSIKKKPKREAEIQRVGLLIEDLFSTIKGKGLRAHYLRLKRKHVENIVVSGGTRECVIRVSEAAKLQLEIWRSIGKFESMQDYIDAVISSPTPFLIKR